MNLGTIPMYWVLQNSFLIPIHKNEIVTLLVDFVSFFLNNVWCHNYKFDCPINKRVELTL